MTREPVSPTRRDFLAASSAAGATLAATGLFAAGAYAGGNDEIRVGLIGCGGRGSGAADNVLHAAKGVKVVAIGDAFEFRVKDLRNRLMRLVKEDSKVQELGNKVDLPEDRCFAGLDAYQRVIDSGANYIILATPPGFRPLFLEAAISAGKNIFTEKPVGVDGPGIKKVLAAAEEAKKKNLAIGAGTQRRHQLGYVETMKRVHDGAIGDITSCRAYWNGGHIWFRKREELSSHGIKDSDLAYQLHNWYHFLWVCGDHIVEQHVHNLDVCNWAMKGHPARCVGMGGRVQPCHDPNVDGNNYNFFAVDYEYPDGTHMLSQCRQIDGCDNNVTEALVGTKGTCLPHAYQINGKRVVTREQDRQSTDPYVQEHTDLIACIRAGRPYNELKGVAESTLTAIMGRLSAYTGKPVTWEQALNSEDTFPRHLSWDMSIQTPPVAVPGGARPQRRRGA